MTTIDQVKLNKRAALMSKYRHRAQSDIASNSQLFFTLFTMLCFYYVKQRKTRKINPNKSDRF